MALLSTAAAARTLRKLVLDPRSFTSPGMTVQSVGRLLSVAVHSAARSAGADAADAVTTAMSVAGVGRAQVYSQRQHSGDGAACWREPWGGAQVAAGAPKRVIREHWKTPLSRVRGACAPPRRRAVRIAVVLVLTRSCARSSGSSRGSGGSSSSTRPVHSREGRVDEQRPAARARP
jgi:uncharacterized phage protein gp47/JayE